MMNRQKILPEDMIQKTNLRQHNLMIGAINEIDERQAIVEDNSAITTARVVALSQKHNDDIAGLEQEFAAFPTEVQTMIIDSFNTHLKNILVDAGMLRFSADNKAIFLQKNRRDGITVEEQIPLSTRQNVGLATPEDLLAIDELTDRVTTLENSGITGELFHLDHDFSGITDAVRTVHFSADIGKPPTVGDSVIDSQQHSWRYVITGATTFGWVLVPHLSIGGDLKAVKSSNADGKIYVENDNTCSVVGWNDVKNDIAGHAGNTTNPHSVTKAQVGLGAYPASPADIGISSATQTALDGKADKTELALKVNTDDIPTLIAPLLPPVNCTELLSMCKGDISITIAPLINAGKCTSLREVFSGCTNLKEVKYIRMPNVTDMGVMFNNCSSLTTIPLLDTSKVTIMANMFSSCSSLTSIPSLDTSNVTDMKYMFAYCSSLTSIPSLDISSATNMQRLFYACPSLTSVTFHCANVRPYGAEMFAATPIASGNGRIYVPDNLVQAYRTASGWSAHASVIFGHSDKP